MNTVNRWALVISALIGLRAPNVFSLEVKCEKGATCIKHVLSGCTKVMLNGDIRNCTDTEKREQGLHVEDRGDRNLEVNVDDHGSEQRFARVTIQKPHETISNGYSYSLGEDGAPEFVAQ